MIAFANLFNDVKAQLNAFVPEVKTVEVWNNQIDHRDTEDAIRYPAVYVELFTPELETNQAQSAMLTEGNYTQGQRGEGGMILHCSFATLKDINDFYLDDVMPLLTKIHCNISMYDGTYYSALNRTSVLPDSDHDQLSDWLMTYTYGVTEPSYEKGLTDANSPVGTISIDIIRSIITETSCSILLNSLTKAQREDCILGSYDFSILDVYNKLSDQQKEDLAAQIFADGAIVTENPEIVTP